MKTLSQRDFKDLPGVFKWAVVNKNGVAWAYSHAPIYCKSSGCWQAKPDDLQCQAMWIGTGYLFGQVIERKAPWWRSVFTSWLDATPQFNNADRYRFARDCLFDNQLWEVWSAIRFAERYDFNAERYDECVDKAIAECIERGIWK